MSNSRVGKVPQKELTPEHSLAVVKETEKCPRSIKRRPQSSQLFLVTKKLGVSTTKYRSDFYPENKKLKEEMKQINECMSKSKDRITKRNVQKISVLAAMKSMPHLKPKYESNNKKLVQKIDECYEEAKGVIPPKQLKSMIDSQK